MPAGRYLRTALLAWKRGTTMPAAPSSLWLHLTTTAPTATTVGTAPTTTGYAPREITPSDWDAVVEAANLDTMSPTLPVRFPAAGTFSGSSSTATHAMLMDGSNPGAANLIEYAQLGAPRDLVSGGFVEFGAGDVDSFA